MISTATELTKAHAKAGCAGPVQTVQRFPLKQARLGARCGNVEQPLILKMHFLAIEFLQPGIDAIGYRASLLNRRKQ